jgi:type IV pilus assembly protein PilW
MNNNSQRGFTLVELMITLVLSLLITYGIAQVLISSNQNSTSSDGVSQAQETARFVMSFVGRQIRATGINSMSDRELTSRTAMGCDVADLNANNACSFNNDAGATEANITVGPGILSGDRLALSWIPPSIDLTYPPFTPGDPSPIFPSITTDCTGATFPGFSPNTTIINTFWVSLDPLTQTNSLFCQGRLYNNVTETIIPPAGAAQVIANGVEAIHFLYGEATNLASDDVTRYVNANEVNDWNRVFAIKVSVMTRSLGDITNSVSTKQYVMLDSDIYTFTDAINRQVFSSTFFIPNRGEE